MPSGTSPTGLNASCPICGGVGQIKSPGGVLFQMCWKCDGSGFDPGRERFFTYDADIVLTALQALSNQRIVINGDAPFRIKLLTRTKSGDFRIRLFDNNGQYFSSAGEGGTNNQVRDACLFGDGQLPFIMVPHPVIPPGGFIGFDLTDISGATNTIHLAFTGAKVYPTV